MINIPLKKRNRPKKPGFYVAQRVCSCKPALLDIREDRGELEIVGAWGIYPLKDEPRSTLWSDEITIKDDK